MQFVSERITTDENICGGNLTICSGRIAVRTVWNF
jgi:uncharacterized protein (DUF433 family)